MIAVILAAGVGSRLRPITTKKPKCMVKVAGRPILDYQIRAYASAGIREIIIIAGYESRIIKDYCKHIKDVKISIVENADYEITNNMYSLYLASSHAEGVDFILSNGDVVFDARIAYEVVNIAGPDIIVADKGSYSEESMKVTLDSSGWITDISKAIPTENAYGNSIDMYRFSAESSRMLFAHIRRIVEVDGNLKDWTEVAIQGLLANGAIRLKPYDIKRKTWVEIDNYDDLALGDRLFSGFDTSFRDKKLFFLDLDGTIYLGNNAVPGAGAFLDRLSTSGIHYYFLSNNSSGSKLGYVQKLTSMGIEITEDKIILSTDALIRYLLENRIKNVFVVGTASMEKSIADVGIETRSESPEYVVLGYDTELTYAKLKKAALYINSGVDILATHCDLVCPTPDGPIPDIGSVLALLEVSTGKKAHRIFGKPNREMVDFIMNAHGVSAKETVFVGDRIYTDMELAVRTGSSFILVLSGETKRDEIEDSDRIPDLIVKSVKELA